MSDVGFGELSVSCYGWRKMFEKYFMSILTREATHFDQKKKDISL